MALRYVGTDYFWTPWADARTSDLWFVRQYLFGVIWTPRCRVYAWHA